MSNSETKKKRSGGKQYLITLQARNSRTALIACVITLFFALYGIAGGLVLYAYNGDVAKELFRYFTVDSNLLTALGAGMLIPFAVEEIRKKRFSYPKWAAMIHYSGTICTTMTMVFALCFISWYNPELAFGGYNILLHIVCPAMVLISFFQVESHYHYSIKDVLLCMSPIAVYAVVYIFNVVILGEANGGWPDIYMLTAVLPVPVTLAGMLLMAFGIAMAIRAVYHRLGDKRTEKMIGSWDDDMDPVEIRIEMYGLGRHAGHHEDWNYAVLPLDLIGMLEEKYHIKKEELIRAYTRGLLDAQKELETRGKQNG